MSVADLVTGFLGSDLPVRFEGYDGSAAGPIDAPARIVLKSKDALRRIATRPGELGFARAYVAGDLEVEGDIFAVLSLRDRLPAVKLSGSQIAKLLSVAGPLALRPLSPPPEEVHLRGARHSKERDAAAIRHHYDVGNHFYEMVLGPSLTYSCAVFTSPAESLESAQANKYELISRKLALGPGMRLLDIGCGWGGMVLHAAGRHGVDGVGVTLSHEQAELAEKRAVEAASDDKVKIRIEDYRDISDGPYDAISSIGMFEHVGESRLAEYFARVFDLLRPGGRLLNHGISRPPGKRARFSTAGFIDRYVFPDGELHEVGRVVSAIQTAGFEVRHVESLREHYGKTLRCWVANLEACWDEAVAIVGPARARIWRLYMAGSAVNFEANRTQIHQVLAVKPDRGRSGLPLRPRFELPEPVSA